MRDLWDAVAARPDDDELLLVVADAFEERGDPLRAELLRVELALSRADPHGLEAVDLRWRARAVRARVAPLERPRWEGGTLEGNERGFPAWLHVRDPQALARILPELPRGVTGVRLASMGEPGELGELPTMPWLRKLVLEPQSAADRLPELLNSPLVHEGLVELTLSDQSLGSQDLRRLAGTAALRGLRALRLRDNHVGAEGMEALAASPHLRGLTELGLGTFPFGNVALFGMDGVQALLRWQAFPRLQILDLSRQEIDAFAAAALLQAPGALRVLDLSENPLTGLPRLRDGGMRLRALRATSCEVFEDDLESLLQAPALEQLRALDLGVNRLPPSLPERLVAAPCWAGLLDLGVQGAPLHRRLAPFVRAARGPAVLDLSKTSLDEDDLAELSRAPWFDQLRSLRIIANRFRSRTPRDGLLAGARHLRQLAFGPEGESMLAGLPQSLQVLQMPAVPRDLELPHLVALDLSANPVKLDALQRLAAAPWFSQLVELGLRECRLPAGAIAILLSGQPRCLRLLRLALNPLGDELGQLLSPELPALEYLSLDPRGVSPELRARLRERPGLRKLVWQGERAGPPADPPDWR